MQSIDLASLLLTGQRRGKPAGQVPHRGAALARAVRRTPALDLRDSSDARRPVQLGNGLAAQLGHKLFKQLPASRPGTSSDLVLLFELGDISLPHAAAHLDRLPPRPGRSRQPPPNPQRRDLDAGVCDLGAASVI